MSGRKRHRDRSHPPVLSAMKLPGYWQIGGASVVATSRRHTAATEESLRDDLRKASIDGNNLAVRTLDLCDVGSVDSFVAWYRQAYGGKLHVLVNNAGILKDVLKPWTVHPLTGDGFRDSLAHQLSRILPPDESIAAAPEAKRVWKAETPESSTCLPTCMTRAGTRICSTTKKTYHPLSAYGRSKLAMIHFSFEIERRFAQEYNLHSMAVHPGSVDTNMTRVDLPEGKLRDFVRRINDTFRAPDNAAQYARSANHRDVCQQVSVAGRKSIMCVAGPREPTDACKDEAVSKRLWDQSGAWVETLVKPDGGEHEQI